MFKIGLGELVVILVVVLLLFGPAKLPEIGKALGKAVREFRNALKDVNEDAEKTGKKEEEKK
ncbi:MAG: twin-arginine translocase TatA/TatE family subunit [Candidatus Omnitrophica bacterium]|nr:twin-arginine translocase TatA/TatE family subunit [Candidatus Omnitrophota bacterium]MDD5352754.1 twin-arginine translocase TatA/TatE family subunit [Candidatus Omnitrophota bacterium]MDD5550353.1 twin-arginine translocase TatA/TatE family subunit [Candidatus Omnitrophota bacterium]